MSLLARIGISDGPPIVPTRGWSAWITIGTAAAMGFLAIVTLAAGLAAGRLADSWRADLSGLSTVVIVSEPADRAARVADALSLLDTLPGIRSVRALSDAEHDALLEPWLGQNTDIVGLPVPSLIEVTLDGVGPDPELVQAELERRVPGARYDTHQEWRRPLIDSAGALEGLAWLASAMVILAAGGMIALSAQATLAGNTAVVRVVRLIGATDRYIAQAFVLRIALRGFAGGVIGAALGVLALFLVPGFGGSGDVEISLAPGTLGAVLLLVAVPIGTTGIAVCASWLAIRSALYRLL
ncbi:MAG: FtsX-like permease family protein [Pseudomonadota bacterium]